MIYTLKTDHKTVIYIAYSFFMSENVVRLNLY